MNKKIIVATGTLLIMFLVISGIFTDAPSRSFEKNSGKTDAHVFWNYTKLDNLEFNVPSNYKDYIMPENQIVQDYANRLEIGSGFNVFVYKNGTVFGLYGKEEKNDVWQSADYTLDIVRGGDCEDFATATASILDVKNMDYVIVLGRVNDNGKQFAHAWVEYYSYNNNDYVAVSNLFSFKRKIETENGLIYYLSPSVTALSLLDSKDKIQVSEMKFWPIYIFNKKIDLRPYDKNWILLI